MQFLVYWLLLDVLFPIRERIRVMKVNEVDNKGTVGDIDNENAVGDRRETDMWKWFCQVLSWAMASSAVRGSLRISSDGLLLPTSI
jgi:hypothetical protein